MLPPEISVRITQSRRREQILRGRGGGHARALRHASADEGGVALQYRQYPVAEEAHVDLGLLMRHRAERIFGDEMVEAGQALQFADLVETIIGGADDLDADVKVRRLLPRLGAFADLGIGARHLAVTLVALDRGEVTIGEMVVVVDRLPLLAEILEGALMRLIAAFGTANIGQDDRRARRVPGGERDLAVAGDIGGGFRPLVLNHHEEAEAELGHDLSRVGADRRGVEAPHGIRDRARPDRGARDPVEIAHMLEALLTERLDDDLGRFDKARPRLLHRYAEP